MQKVYEMLNGFVNSWYGVVTVLGGLFLILVREELKKLVSKISIRYQKADVTIGTSEEQVNVLEDGDFNKIQTVMSDLHIHADKEFKDFLTSIKKHLVGHTPSKSEVKELVHSIFIIKEQYEFAYLNLFLVANAKRALQSLQDLGGVTKELFLSSIFLPKEIQDQPTEKEVIFNALYCHHLITVRQNLCEVTDKGARFLNFAGDL